MITLGYITLTSIIWLVPFGLIAYALIKEGGSDESGWGSVATSFIVCAMLYFGFLLLLPESLTLTNTANRVIPIYKVSDGIVIAYDLNSQDAISNDYKDEIMVPIRTAFMRDNTNRIALVKRDYTMGTLGIYHKFTDYVLTIKD